MKKKIYASIERLLSSVEDHVVRSHVLMDIHHKFHEAEGCKFVRDDAQVAVTITVTNDAKKGTTLIEVGGPFYLAEGELLSKGATWCVGPFSMEDVKGSG